LEWIHKAAPRRRSQVIRHIVLNGDVNDRLNQNSSSFPLKPVARVSLYQPGLVKRNPGYGACVGASFRRDKPRQIYRA